MRRLPFGFACGRWRLAATRAYYQEALDPRARIAGRVVEKGASVHQLEVGDCVGVPWVYWTCGECDFCREGNENLCVKQKITGVTVDGGYAEFVKVPASHATKIPEGLSAVDAAPLSARESPLIVL